MSIRLAHRHEANLALDRFLHEVGIPSEMLTDNISELAEGNWETLCRQHYIRQRFTEPYLPWQNPSELAGGIVKRRVRQLMRKTDTPIRLWDYCWAYVSDTRSLTATNHIWLHA